METTTDQSTLYRKPGFDPGYLEAFQEKVFIEGPHARRKLVNFFVLLLLATVIATYGVLSGSTATVIGAMIVAPLMGPIMATTAAIVMGSAHRALNALALVVIGVFGVILFSWLLTLPVPPSTISFTTNGEIASRINPGLYALLTALGAGAAGAFITSRSEIADSIGGVAIAISLVPPLCVVGISLSQGEWAAAGGALLLFLANCLAILLAGGVVFMLVGLGRLALSQAETGMRRKAFALVIVCTVLVTVPLALSAWNVIEQRAAENVAAQATLDWLKGTENHLVSVGINDYVVQATIEGQDEPKPLDELEAELEAALHKPVAVTLRFIPARITSSNNPPSP